MLYKIVARCIVENTKKKLTFQTRAAVLLYYIECYGSIAGVCPPSPPVPITADNTPKYNLVKNINNNNNRKKKKNYSTVEGNCNDCDAYQVNRIARIENLARPLGGGEGEEFQ